MPVSVLGIITARGGSKGVPGKNIRPVCGIPLIAYTIDVALRSSKITRTIVSTDDTEIASIAREWGAEVPFMRPSELALDDTPHLPVVRHALEFCESQENRVYDQVFIFQPTSPLREVSDVDGAIKLLEDTGADSVVGLVSIEDHHPLRVKRIENGKIVPFYDSEPVGARRQDLRPKAYVRSGSVYAINRGAVMGKGSLLGEDSRPWIMSQDKGVNVDTEEDLIILQHYIPKLFPGLI